MSAAPAAPKPKKPFYRTATFAIFVALVLGIFVGGLLPEDAHPQAHYIFACLSKAFVGLIKGLIVPLIFSTLVVGVAQTGDLKSVGRMGGKALLYFEIVTTFALGIGLVIANVFKPGAGLPLPDPTASAAAAAVTVGEAAGAAGPAKSIFEQAVDIFLHAIPTNLFHHAASEGEILPIVVFASLFGVALTSIGPRGKPVFVFFDGVAQAMFRYTEYVMKLTPMGVFGAMAGSVSHMAAGQTIGGEVVKGWGAVFFLLGQYAKLVGSLYLALFSLVLLVFVPVMLLCKIPVLKFFKTVRDPALTAFSTASSEAALPLLLERVEQFGVPKRVAGFVIPAGYSFNLDGSTLYLVLASLAIAQAGHIEMPLGTQLVMMATLMLTSKGVAGVPRATLVIIAATCAAFKLPGEAGFAMLLAVDQVMDMARTTINVIGNGLASVVVAKWEGVFGTEAFDDPNAPALAHSSSGIVGKADEAAVAE